MKKQLIILVILLSIGLLANAQKEYRLAKSTGNLKLTLGQAIVEGYDGKEIIFSGKGTESTEVDERAKGLLPLSSSGYVDNTGLGISVTQDGTDVIVKAVSSEPIGILTIKVPQNMKISFIDNNSFSTFLSAGNSIVANNGLLLKNLKGEIEISITNNKVRLENNTGPMNIKTVHGPIEAVFNNEIKGPISIISVYDYVDITLPATTKANLELATSSGKLYAGKEFAIDIDKNSEKTQISIGGVGTLNNSVSGIEVKPRTLQTTATGGYAIDNSSQAISISYFINGGEKIKGKINGGGVDLIFKSTNKNVYLRQK
jgi:hypothetical protein